MAIIKFKINQEEHYIEGGGIQNDTTGTTDVIEKIRSGTKAEYDLLGTYDPDIYYIITDEGEGREYIISNTTGTTQKITNIRKGTQAEYDLLGTYDSKCYYIISDKPEPIVNNRTGTTGIVESIWYGTKAEFDLITTKDEKCIYVVDTPQTTIGPGIYHNATLGVISLSSDGINWITIADKNLGATQVYNVGDTQNISNCGNAYQWGNNYGVPYLETTGINIGADPGDLSGYGPGNYFNNNTIYSDRPDADVYPNLWGGETGTDEATQGPCPIGYHVPLPNDIYSLLQECENLGILQSISSKRYNIINNGFQNFFKIPRNVSADIDGGNIVWLSGSDEIFRGSGCDPDEPTYSEDWYIYFPNETGTGYDDTQTGSLRPIRPFKNEPVTPDNTWTVLYQPTP